MAKDKPFLRRHNASYMQRRVDVIPIRQRFLIFCEGGKTEPNYFKKFRCPQMVIEVEGLGMNTVGLIRFAINRSDRNEYDQTWCVFDKDDFPVKNVNAAFTLAKNNNISVAYSNQAFELWYVLHFDYMDNSISRDQYMRILDRKLGHEYEKNSLTIYDELYPRLKNALRNASTLISTYPQYKPAKNDPSTTVHLLVEQLITFSNPFGGN